MINLVNLKKSEIIQRAKWKCPLPGHSKHNGLEHPRCYEKFSDIKIDKMCILDIETEDLNADFGIIFCWAILDIDSNKIVEDVITLDDIKKYKSAKRNVHPKEDFRIIESLVKTLKNYQWIITHYGSLFDLKFVRTRAVICNIPFPEFGSMYQRDTIKMLWSKFKLRRNNLASASRNLIGKTRKDHLSLAIKHGCLRGEKWALDDTIKHCRKDVLDTRDLYKKIHSFVRKSKTSI